MFTGDFIFCSGQIGLDPKTGELADGLESQVKQIFHNIKAVLKEEYCDLNSIVKTTVFLTDLNNFQAMNELYEKEMGDHKPARSTIGVKELPKGAIVEIEVIATK
jgi:2-iminobutanoate/2-iminopropanoate deaminase